MRASPPESFDPHSNRLFQEGSGWEAGQALPICLLWLVKRLKHPTYGSSGPRTLAPRGGA